MFRSLSDFARTFRLGQILVVASVLVAGVLASGYSPTFSDFLWMGLFVLSGHIFGYGLNELSDRKFDERNVKYRRRRIHIRHPYTHWLILLITLLQLPLILVGGYLVFGYRPAIWLILAALASVSVYNLLGKRAGRWVLAAHFFFPLSMVLLCLAGYTLFIPTGPVTPVFILVLISLFFNTALSNTTLGGLYDLKWDYESGILSGVVQTGSYADGNRLHISKPTRWMGYGLYLGAFLPIPAQAWLMEVPWFYYPIILILSIYGWLHLWGLFQIKTQRAMVRYDVIGSSAFLFWTISLVWIHRLHPLWWVIIGFHVLYPFIHRGRWVFGIRYLREKGLKGLGAWGPRGIGSLGVVILLSGVVQGQEGNPLMRSWPQYLEHRNNTPYGMEWIQLGPVINSARVDAVQCDPSRPGTWYAGFGSGNLWKTTDHGLRWKPVFENQPALSIGDFTLAPSNPDIIYLGTGEYLKKPRNFTLPGVGVFRSDDGGETWRNIGLEQSWHIAKIKVHPQNPDIAFVAVLGRLWSPSPERGIYRTMDGGKSWERVLYVNDHTGGNDVVIAPSDPNIVYASTWENYPGIYGRESAVYRSTDGGTTWQKLGGGLPDGNRNGRTGLAVSWQNPLKVYAFADNLNRPQNRSAECYLTTDGGNTWKRTHEEDLLLYSVIGWYFSDCAVNPQNDDEIYLLGIRMAHSTDGGKHFSMIGGDVFHLFPSPAVPFHLDQCDIWINPLNPQELAVGNDGGFYYSYNRGRSWMHYNNLPTGEFYDISVDERTPYKVYGGTQDDASVYGPAKEWNPRFADEWSYIWVDAWAGGDGCYTLADPEDPNIIYTSSQNGGIFRKDMAADRSVHIQPRLPRGTSGKLNYNFIAPYIISRYDPKVLYHAGNYLFKSLNKGDTWELISPDFSVSADPAKASTAAGALAESPLQPGLLAVGTDKGSVWITTDDGKNWTERSTGLPDAYIRSIITSGHKKERIYVALTGINNDDLSAHLFVSEDLGVTWRSITGNLPDETVNCIAEDPLKENFLYAGLHRGVFISTNRGESWSLLGNNLAPTVISDLVIQKNEMDLVAGTHGRGIYKMSLRPIHEAYANGEPTATRLFSVPDLIAPTRNDTHRDINEKSVHKTEITWWQASRGPVQLSVKQGNKLIREFTLSGRKGFNQFRWDGVVSEKEGNDAYFYNPKIYIEPGRYTLVLTAEGIEEKGEFVVR